MQASRKETPGKPVIRDYPVRTLVEPWGIDLSRVAALRGACEIFAEICADFEECCATLQGLECTARNLARQADDYSEMRQLLAGEIQHCLLGVSPCQCCRRMETRTTPKDRKTAGPSPGLQEQAG